MKFSDFISDPYAFNLAISISCRIQSNAFDRSVSTCGCNVALKKRRFFLNKQYSLSLGIPTFGQTNHS